MKFINQINEFPMESEDGTWESMERSIGHESMWKLGVCRILFNLDCLPRCNDWLEKHQVYLFLFQLIWDRNCGGVWGKPAKNQPKFLNNSSNTLSVLRPNPTTQSQNWVHSDLAMTNLSMN